MKNKHQAMVDWVAPFLDGEFLYFENAEAYSGVRELVPNYGDNVRYTDVCGFKYKTYGFVFIGFEQIDTGMSTKNADTREVFDAFNTWLEEQEQNGNYPDFSDPDHPEIKYQDFEIVPLQNTANLAEISDDGLAKYMLGAQINYVEYKEE